MISTQRVCLLQILHSTSRWRIMSSTMRMGSMLSLSMQDSEFFHIMGQDFAYATQEEELPPTIVSSELYPPLVMLLIGMFAALSVRAWDGFASARFCGYAGWVLCCTESVSGEWWGIGVEN